MKKYITDKIFKIIVNFMGDVNLENSYIKRNFVKILLNFIDVNRNISHKGFLDPYKIHVTDSCHVFLLMYSAMQGHLHTTKLLIEHGANVNIKNKNGWTALHYAVIGNHLRVALFLIMNGADVNAKLDSGNTALDIARPKTKKILKLFIAMRKLITN